MDICIADRQHGHGNERGHRHAGKTWTCTVNVQMSAMSYNFGHCRVFLYNSYSRDKTADI